MAEPSPKIIKAAEKLRRGLLRGDDRALRQMEHAYGAAWRRVRQEVVRLSKLIDTYQAEGRTAVLRIPGSKAKLGPMEYSVDMFRREARYHQLMFQMEQELLKFSRAAAAMVGDQQRRGLEAGQEHAQFLLEESLGPVPRALRGRIVATWNKVPEAAFENLVGFLSDGSPLAYKFAGLPAEVVTGVKQTLEAGFAAGWNPKKVAREVQRTFGGALTNAKVTCRTEYMRAYRTASHETYRANSDVCTGWIWVCARQARTCAACWAMDGTEHPLSERMTDHPGGRCTQIPMTKSWAEIMGRDAPGIKETSAKGWDPEPAFRQMSPADQRRVLGPVRYQLWKDGKVNLRDCATRKVSSVWGDHYRPTSVKELIASGKVTWEDIHAARSASRIAPKKTSERKAELTSFAKSAELALKEITKTESRWSGKLHFRSMTRAAGRKDWNCDITLHPGYTKEAKNAYPTINHEMFHALSVGLTPEAYKAHPGWEEGVVEQLQRIHGSKVKDAAGMAHTGSWSYQAYIDSHETIRGFLGVDKERYYVKLLRTPLEKRRTLVERALKKTPVPPGVRQAIERLDEYT